MLIVLASLVAGCVAAWVYAGWSLRRQLDPCVELQTVWAVNGLVFTDDDENVFEYAAEFAAPTRTEATRQYGYHVRSLGWWVGGLTDVYRAGVVTVTKKGAKA